MSEFAHFLDLTRRHNQFLEERIDLVASNSWISSFARLTMSSLLSNSYCIGLPGNRFYGGCSYIDMLEREVIELATELFGAPHAVVQFLSGMQANIGAYNAILRPGDKIVSAPAKYGGHYSHNPSGPLRFFQAQVLEVPFDVERYNIDVAKLEELFDRERPRLLVAGWSEFPFPHPMKELRELCDKYGVRLMYDMSHVAGLIAGKEFQADAGQYADILTSSTGKSLHAPDHGLVLFHDEELKSGILDAVMPLLTSNTHPQELAALGIALSEMKTFGEQYAKQTVRNTQALGRELSKRGIKALYEELGYSQSHTLLVEIEEAQIAVQLLDNAGISTNTTLLPWDMTDKPSGLRLGTQVITRRGFKEAQMEQIADAIYQVLIEQRDPVQVRYEFVRPLCEQFMRCEYSFDTQFPLGSDWMDRPYRFTRSEDPLSLALAVPALAELSLNQMRDLAKQFKVMHLRGGEMLFSAGDFPDSVYFVVDGHVDILDGTGANRKTVATMGSGTHLGELGVLKEQTRKYSARAREATVLLVIEAAGFRQLIKNNEQLDHYFQLYCSTIHVSPVI